MSSAFHARCADPDSAEARERWHRLSPEELAEVATWLRPTDLILENGAVLSYADAHKELSLGLDALGRYSPKGTPGNLTEGTCDLCFVVEADGLRIVYVPDIKRSEYTVADGPRSLQILGYAMAACQKFGADGYCAGIWAAKEGKWWWGDLFLWGRDDDAMCEHWERVKAAALNSDPEPNVGQHCHGCYGRTSCPAWLLPPELAESSLAPFTKEGMQLTNAEAVKLLQLVKRTETMADVASKLLRAHVRSGNRVIDETTGKEWKPIQVSGRVTLNADQLEKDEPELFMKYRKEGASYEQWRWVNLESSKKARKG